MKEQGQLNKRKIGFVGIWVVDREKGIGPVLELYHSAILNGGQFLI